jgi:hypothetical protein
MFDNTEHIMVSKKYKKKGRLKQKTSQSIQENFNIGIPKFLE